MPFRLFILAIFLLHQAAGFAQGLFGTLRNAKGEPLPYVTIYCPELKKGTNSNVDGSFRLALGKGMHQVIFQSIDYQTLNKTIEINESWLELNLLMQEQSYALREVKVSGKNENTADYIMRKAIAAAPYYRRQILTYTAKVYVKGTGKVDHAPILLKGLIKNQGIEIGRTYVTESINELEFRQPNTYREKVISLKSSMPFEGAPEPMRMARGSWYDTRNNELVSPLSPQAFSLYNFKLLGSFYENGREINKIQVIPKRKGNNVFYGSLYIIENLWCLHSCVLSHTDLGMTVSVKTSFKPMADHPFVYLPVTYDIEAIGDYLGVKGSFRYLASLSNYQIRLNPNINHDWLQKQLPVPIAKEDESVQTKNKAETKSKNSREIEALLAKEKLSKMDMLKLASKMKKESELSAKTWENQNDSTEIKLDSLALKRDTAFWEANRPVPLLADEAKSFMGSDTLHRAGSDSLSAKHKKPYLWTRIIYGGDSIPTKSKKYYFSYKGILQQPYLNTVEGFGLRGNLSVGNTQYRSLRFSQLYKIPLERQAIQLVSSLQYRFSPKHFGFLNASGGSLILDYNSKGIGTYTDAFQLLLYQQNFSKWYQQEFLQMNIQGEVFRGLTLQVNLLGARRFSLENLNHYKNQERQDGLHSNVPSFAGSEKAYTTYQVSGGMVFRPFQNYRMKNNIKYLQANVWPILSLQYQTGFNQTLQFSQLNFGLNQDIHLRHWVKLSYQLTLGEFLQTPELHFADYQHFAGNQSYLLEGPAKFRFQQLPYYEYSSSKSYQSFQGQFECTKLLLRHLPYFNLMDFKEVVYYNYLQSDQLPNYQEFGYRLDQIFNRLSIGINFHYIDQLYRGSGIFVGIQLR